MEMITGALLLMGITGTLLGVIIALFARFFKTDSDARVELVQELLPGANCGGCGKAGCADFAKSVVAGENPPSRCPVSSQEQINAIALALGISADSGVRKRAVVRCGGDMLQTKERLNYNGVCDCNAAAMVAGGPKGCRYGCLGMGSCANVCPFGAIEIVNNLALVHRELCVGCGKCAEVCPRSVIALVPADAEIHVYCNSPEKGAEKRKQCKVGCIGCRKCAKYSPEQFVISGTLASVNYEAASLPGEEDVEKIQCPTGALLSAREHHYIETHDPNWKKEEK
ncbi:MAG: RnfABCDGE type electron transport complex subunit B [Lentisphaeria bacterium]|nr:RnfABCDGE type electron transport complex subunit B [Lentisphaeria bacterium]